MLISHAKALRMPSFDRPSSVNAELPRGLRPRWCWRLVSRRSRFASHEGSAQASSLRPKNHSALGVVNKPTSYGWSLINNLKRRESDDFGSPRSHLPAVLKKGG
jgi:hypothetical protein